MTLNIKSGDFKNMKYKNIRRSMKLESLRIRKQ